MGKLLNHLFYRADGKNSKPVLFGWDIAIELSSQVAFVIETL